MDDTLERLIRFRELRKVAGRVTPEVLDELRSMSAATIDRYLRPHKDTAYPVALSGTKPSHILRSSIPLRTAMDDPLTAPGFLELDTVTHCGHMLKGEFLWTLFQIRQRASKQCTATRIRPGSLHQPRRQRGQGEHNPGVQ
jgi:hypothetical protein